MQLELVFLNLGFSLFQLTVKAPLALLVCQPERQQSESATSSSWVCATDGHLDPRAKPHETECIFNLEECICVASFTSKSVCLHDACMTPVAPSLRSSLRLLSTYWMHAAFSNWQIHISGCASAVGLCPESHRPERQPSLSNSHKVSL